MILRPVQNYFLGIVFKSMMILTPIAIGLAFAGGLVGGHLQQLTKGDL